MPQKRISIFGAGISGLIAAISLARLGIKVEVREKRGQVGGSPHWHPSVHQQTFDLEKTSEYIGVDITPCFHAVNKHIFYFYGRRSEIRSPENSYVCEKGQRPSSIENYLYSLAENAGVKFVFGEGLDARSIKYIDKLGPNCIIATGLEQKAYRTLNIRHANIQGFRSFTKRTQETNSIISYFGHYTNQDFAYVASFGDLAFSLLFARKGISKRNLEAFRQHLLDSEELSFTDWQYSTGCVPLEKNFIKNNMVLAGTISGMIDPFYLNGISGALISGKIAALFFIDRDKALKEFNRFTRNFGVKACLKRILDKLPVKKFAYPLISLLNDRLKWVGVI